MEHNRGHLLLVHESFELNQVEKEDRDRVLSDFCKMADLSKSDKDIFYALPDLFTHNYSYGNIYSGLIYKSWTDINTDNNLKGISPTSHQLLYTLFFSYPSFAKQTDIEAFDCLKEHKGYAGFEYLTEFKPYIKCIKSWHDWKIEWFSENQHSIKWKDDDFLPNKEYSNQILYCEVLKHNKKDQLTKEYNNDIVTTFHEEVMKHKSSGGEKEAYIDEIGTKICLSNYYVHEHELSKQEKDTVRSLRKIFSILNLNGEKQYISLDFEKGMFEFHNSKGEHLGEYRFDGSSNSKAKADHNLNTIFN